jgi:hypothetical protein
MDTGMSTAACSELDETLHWQRDLFLDANFERLRVSPKDKTRLWEHHAQNVEIELSPSGIPCMVLSGMPIYEDENPIQEAKRMVDALVGDDDANAVVLFGLGLGYHAEQMEQRFSCSLIIYDPSADALRYTLGGRNLNLKKSILVTTVGRLMGEVEQRLQFNDKKITAAAVPSYQRLFPKQFEEFVQALNQAQVNANILESTTAIRTGDWIRHSVKNIPKAAGRKGIDILFDKFKGKPGILVSAGPSLDKNIHDLKAAMNHAVIISVNAAAAPLAKAGIKPDIIAVVEGLDLRAQFQELPWLNDTVVAPALYCFPGFYDLPARDILPVPDTTALCGRWFARAFSKPHVPSGGSVSCMAFSLLNAFGCDPLIVIGQDLAYTGGLSYTTGATFGKQTMRYDKATGRLIQVDEERNNAIESIRQASGLALLDNFEAAEVPAWGGLGGVLSVKMFNLFRSWFENAARTLGQERILINATEGGARIAGFLEMTLTEALLSYCKESFDVTAVINEAETSAPPNHIGALVQTIEEDLNSIRTIIRIAEAASRVAKQASSVVERESVTGADPELRQLAALENELGFLTRKNHIIDSYVSGKVNQLRQDRFLDMDENIDRRTVNSLKRTVHLLEVVTKGCEELTNLFVPLAAELREMES